MLLMTRTASSLQTPPGTRYLLWLVLFALMGLQSLGVIHRQIHADNRTTSTLSTASAQFSSALFATHTSALEVTEHESLGKLAASCQLFDVAASGVALSPALPSLLAISPVVAANAPPSALWIAALFGAYDARGPPALI
jgi:hypothetical protein